MSSCQCLVISLFLLLEQPFILTALSPSVIHTTSPTTMPTSKPTLKSDTKFAPSLSTTLQPIEVNAMTDHSSSSSPWARWLNSPFFIPSAVGLGTIVYTLCTFILCCYWRSRKKAHQPTKLEIHHHISETSIVPRCSVYSKTSNVSDARSMVSTYSNLSPQTKALTRSSQSTLVPLDSPTLYTVSSRSGIAPPTIDVIEQVNSSEVYFREMYFE